MRTQSKKTPTMFKHRNLLALALLVGGALDLARGADDWTFFDLEQTTVDGIAGWMEKCHSTPEHFGNQTSTSPEEVKAATSKCLSNPAYNRVITDITNLVNCGYHVAMADFEFGLPSYEFSYEMVSSAFATGLELLDHTFYVDLLQFGKNQIVPGTMTMLNCILDQLYLEQLAVDKVFYAGITELLKGEELTLQNIYRGLGTLISMVIMPSPFYWENPELQVIQQCDDVVNTRNMNSNTLWRLLFNTDVCPCDHDPNRETTGKPVDEAVLEFVAKHSSDLVKAVNDLVPLVKSTIQTALQYENFHEFVCPYLRHGSQAHENACKIELKSTQEDWAKLISDVTLDGTDSECEDLNVLFCDEESMKLMPVFKESEFQPSLMDSLGQLDVAAMVNSIGEMYAFAVDTCNKPPSDMVDPSINGDTDPSVQYARSEPEEGSARANNHRVAALLALSSMILQNLLV